mmetsp:Transcript_11268/g.22187  ORF Transcript_11268/g.22187 Transcript_11268/m.22187 type:complete len:95 (+) Transcript_11268:2074-2358(+)
MAEGAVYEIDRILKRTTLLYAAYSAVSLGIIGLSVNSRPWKLLKKVAIGLPCGLLVSGTLTMMHISLKYTQNEMIYLKVGLDPEYPEIRRKVKK